MYTTFSSPRSYQISPQKVLDATLKEITAALLESDVNVKLVASLRQKVKAKVKSSLEGSSTDKAKDMSRKNLIQRVGPRTCHACTLSHHFQAVFDELVHLVDPGVEPYKPKKGQSNVIMAVGLQVRVIDFHPWVLPLTYLPFLGKW
jgi:signal recognition particle subunit SRP54